MSGGVELSEVARQTLCELVTTHGQEVASDARRCEGLLRDFCGQHRREIFVLVSALRDGVPADLLAHSGAVPAASYQAQLAKRLEEHLAITPEAAVWTVESWAKALNLVQGSKFKVQSEEAGRDQVRSGLAAAGEADGAPGMGGTSVWHVVAWMVGVAVLWAGVGGAAAALVASVTGVAAQAEQHMHWIATGALAGAMLGAFAGVLMRAVGGAAGELVSWAVNGTVGGAALGAALAGAAGALAGFAVEGPTTATSRGLQWAAIGATAGAVLTTFLGAASWRPDALREMER